MRSEYLSKQIAIPECLRVELTKHKDKLISTARPKVKEYHYQLPHVYIITETPPEFRARIRNQCMKAIPTIFKVTSLVTNNQPIPTIPNLIEPDDHMGNNLINVVISTTGESLEYRNLIKGPDHIAWKKAPANDLG